MVNRQLGRTFSSEIMLRYDYTEDVEIQVTHGQDHVLVVIQTPGG